MSERERERESRGCERKGEDIPHALLLECTTVCCGVIDWEVECLIKHITTGNKIISYRKTENKNI